MSILLNDSDFKAIANALEKRYITTKETVIINYKPKVNLKGFLRYNTSKVQLDFKKGTKNDLLNNSNGYLSLRVRADEHQNKCPYSHALIGYTISTISGTVIAKVAFQKDAMTLLTILEGETYSKKGLLWNESKVGYIHLKDTSMIAHIKEVINLLPETVKVLTAESHVKGRIRKARRLR